MSNKGLAKASLGLYDYEGMKVYERMQRAARDRKRQRAKRLRARDAEYAASPCAAPVTVEERDLRNSELGQILRIETRGTCPIASNVRHLTHL